MVEDPLTDLHREVSHTVGVAFVAEDICQGRLARFFT